MRDLAIVTGGAGFIGSEMVRHLAVRGERVLAVDNLVNGKREHLAGVLDDRVRLAEQDVRDLGALAPALGEASVVYHLACLGVRHSVHAPLENHDVNATATLRLLDACRAAQVPKFVYVSSSEVYGTARQMPMTEDHPTVPSTVYGGSKLAGEAYTRAFHQTYGYATVVVRPFNTYGPRSHHEGDSGEVIPKFLLRSLAGRPMVVFGDGTQTRDFSYVSDTARGIILAATADAAVGRTINLGSGSEIAINDLARLVARVAGAAGGIVHDEPRPGDVLRLYADASLARKLLGYRAEVGFEQGLQRLLAWYQSLGLTPDQLLEREVVRNWTPA